MLLSDSFPLVKPGVGKRVELSPKIRLKRLTLGPTIDRNIRHGTPDPPTCLASGTPGAAVAVLTLFPLSPGRVRLEFRLLESCDGRRIACA